MCAHVILETIRRSQITLTQMNRNTDKDIYIHGAETQTKIFISRDSYEVESSLVSLFLCHLSYTIYRE